MKLTDKIKAFFTRKPKVAEEKRPPEAEEKPSEPESITEKQGLN